MARNTPGPRESGWQSASGVAQELGEYLESSGELVSRTLPFSAAACGLTVARR